MLGGLYYLLLRAWFRFVVHPLARVVGGMPVSDAAVVVPLIRSEPIVGGLGGVISHLHLDVVVKRNRIHTWRDRLSAHIVRDYREAVFYAEFGFHDYEWLPKIYSSRWRPMFGDSCVVMERIQGDVLKIHLGNQQNVFGEPTPSAYCLAHPGRAPQEILFPLVTQCAELHASRWRDRSLLRETWLKGAAWYSGGGRREWEHSLQWARDLFSEAVKTRGFLLPESLQAHIAQTLDRSSFQDLAAYLADPKTPFCLVHGDFHAGNVMVRESASNPKNLEFKVVDWQQVGVFDPTVDLAQLFISDVHADLYEDLAPRVLAVWYAEVCRLLDQAGRTPPVEYGFDEARALANMLRGGVERWTFLLAVLIAFPAVNDQAVSYFAKNLHTWLRLATKYLGPNPDPPYRVRSLVLHVV